MSIPYSSTIVGISSSPAGHPHQRGDRADGDTGDQPGQDPGGRGEIEGGEGAEVVGGQRGGDQDQQSGQDPVEGGRAHPGGPGDAQPGTDDAAGKQVDHDRPVWGQVGERDRREAGRQSTGDHDESEGLVQDHRLKGDEPEQPDQQQEAELRPPSPIIPPSRPTRAPAAKTTVNGRCRRLA
jgi:hypothetical protein